MPAPFPGMDPYIEDPDIWTDFQHDLASEIRASLNHQIPPRYVAKIIPRVTYEIIEIEDKRSVRPDVGVWQPVPLRGGIAEAVVAPTTTPIESMIRLESPLRLYTIEVHEVGIMKLVAAIEILSPVNKRPSHEAFDEYQRKRRELLRSQTHLLEIDLLRAGTRPPLDRPVPAAPYYVTLSRVPRRPRAFVWPIQLRSLWRS